MKIFFGKPGKHREFCNKKIVATLDNVIQVAAVDAVEYGSVIAPGSKKQNLNHLLNFHYAPREGSGSMWRSGGRQGLNRWMATHKHKYNKEQFLQANCQFVVKADGDYSVYNTNPDILVDWGLIEQIVIKETTGVNPSVVAAAHPRFSVGDHITMQLMKRAKGCLSATPVTHFGLRPADTIPAVSETSVNTFYSKLLLATTDDVRSILECERKELEVQLGDEHGAPEMCFIEQALELLKQRSSQTEPQVSSVNKNSPITPDITVLEQNLTDDKTMYYSCAFDDEFLPAPTSDNSEVENAAKIKYSLDESCVLHARPRYRSQSSEEGSSTFNLEDRDTTPTNTLKYFYFYQASDGQHIYLHAINARMMEHSYGSLEQCPSTFTARIVEKESGSITEDLRCRLRYLQHLPVTCQLEVVELNLAPPIVSRHTLQYFQDQLEGRRKRRQRRARDENRREKEISEQEKKAWGLYPTPHIQIQSYRHFPQYNLLEDETPLAPEQDQLPYASTSEASLSSTSGITSNTTSMNAAMESLSLDSQKDTTGPSFAQMLREGKKDWPLVCAPIGVVVKSKIETRSIADHPDSDVEPEGYVPAPTYRQSFSDSIALALERATAEGHGGQGETAPASGKKKKRQKQKILPSAQPLDRMVPGATPGLINRLSLVICFRADQM
uniref:Uncharacterized protein n=2 Tax=Timema TaxID=61471 RepID=A0A7R9F351_9NEOP|nr:unnamed protein product [Timema bartmani]